VTLASRFAGGKPGDAGTNLWYGNGLKCLKKKAKACAVLFAMKRFWPWAYQMY